MIKNTVKEEVIIKKVVKIMSILAIVSLISCIPSVFAIGGSPGSYWYAQLGSFFDTNCVTGASAVVHPYNFHFDTDWWSHVEEYWMQTTVLLPNQHYAEVALDVTYDRWFGVWTTTAYAIYSDNGYSGSIAGSYTISSNSVGPSTATIQVVRDGTTWRYYVGGYQFASHTFSEVWAGDRVITELEAYNQPQAGHYGSYVGYISSITWRDSNGNWQGNVPYGNNYAKDGWQIGTWGTAGYVDFWSTRS